MDGLNRFTDRECFDIDEWSVDFFSGGAIATRFVDMRECDSVCFFFKAGTPWTPGETVTLTVVQDIAAEGTPKNVYVVTPIAPIADELFACEVKASDLDLDNDFVKVQMSAVLIGGAPGSYAAIGRLWGNFHRMPPVCPTLAEVFDPENTTPEEGEEEL